MVRPKSLLVSTLAVAALLSGVSAAAAPAGRVTALSGSLVGAKADGKKIAMGIDSAVDEGDTLLTYEESRATIRFNDGSTVMLRPDSRFRVQQFGFAADEPAKDKAILSLLKGGLRAITGLVGKRTADSYKMHTPTATIGIRGTDYALLYCAGGECANLEDTAGKPLADGLHIEVLEGNILVGNEGGGVSLGAGQFGFVKDPGSAPAAAPSGYRNPPPAGGSGACNAR